MQHREIEISIKIIPKRINQRTSANFVLNNRPMDSRLKFRCLKSGIFEKFSNEKSLQDSRNRIFRIVRYRRIFSESESGIRTTLPDRRQYVYFSSPTPINLISFLGSVFLGSGVSYLFFHPLCARVGCTHRIRVTGLYVETFHPREVRGGGGEIDFPFIRGNVGYVARTRDESLRLPQRKSLSTSTRAES